MQQAIESTYVSDRARLITQALGAGALQRDNLNKKPRIFEQVVRALLFAAGIISVFTTAFIVIYLGTEAVSFFGARAWIQAKTLVVDDRVEAIPMRSDEEGVITTDSTILLLDVPEGARIPFTPGSLIQVDEEIMRVSERRERSIVIQRTQLGTTAVAHPPGTPVRAMTEVSIRVTEAITPETTVLTVPPGYGKEFQAGDTIHVETETMRISAVEGDSLTVERGIEGTEVRVHPADTVIEVERRPDVLQFFTNIRWQPQTGEFGVLPLVEATLITTFFGLLVAIPVGMAAAIYLSEYATTRVRNILNPVLEILVGVPTVVYGFFALQFVTLGVLQPLLGRETISVYNTLSAGIVVGIMIIPTIASMSLDAMSSVPRSLREASFGLGATKLETTVKVVLPAALSGIVAAIILGTSRAIGETMIVAIAAGAGPNWTFPPNPLVGAETMTGHIARISGGDLSYQSIDYTSIFAIGMTLFVITFVLTQLSTMITRRFREVYQ